MVPVMLTHGADAEEHDVVAGDESGKGEEVVGCVTSPGSAAAGGGGDTLGDVSGVAQAEADTVGGTGDQAQANVDRFVAEIFGREG